VGLLLCLVEEDAVKSEFAQRANGKLPLGCHIRVPTLSFVEGSSSHCYYLFEVRKSMVVTGNIKIMCRPLRMAMLR